MSCTHSWLNPKLEVRASQKHDKGVFAKAEIEKGERLAIFGGDIMLIDEIDAMPEKLQDYEVDRVV